jgi:hypothetical protein
MKLRGGFPSWLVSGVKIVNDGVRETRLCARGKRRR